MKLVRYVKPETAKVKKQEVAFSGINPNTLVSILRSTGNFSSVKYEDIDETTFEIVCRKKELSTELSYGLIFNLVRLCRRAKYQFSLNAEPKYINLMFTVQPF